MKRVLGMMFVVLAIATIAFGANNTPGTWKYNAAKSKAAPGASPITSATVTYEAIDWRGEGDCQRRRGGRLEDRYRHHGAAAPLQFWLRSRLLTRNWLRPGSARRFPQVAPPGEDGQAAVSKENEDGNG